jgi:hypothetical protein
MAGHPLLLLAMDTAAGDQRKIFQEIFCQERTSLISEVLNGLGLLSHSS